jgi:hypothetical protein
VKEKRQRANRKLDGELGIRLGISRGISLGICLGIQAAGRTRKFYCGDTLFLNILHVH